MRAITPSDVAALMAGAAPHAVLDVRERATYERGQVYRATSLPRRLLEIRLPRLVTAPATPLVLYDDDGRLAALAATTAIDLGYVDVRVLAGGLDAWRADGCALVQGLNVPSKVFGERVLHERATPEITPEELHRRLESGARQVIVDARTPEEYARGCIPGAWSLPGGELVLRIGELVRDDETPIVVHCGGRTRSYLGVESLRRMNLPNPIAALRNGTMGWELAGLALERGAARAAPPASAASRRRAAEVARRVAAEDRTPELFADELRHLWGTRERRNVYLLDVRTREEYEAGHLPGATWAPGGQLVQATDEYVAVANASVVLVCDDGARSLVTAGWLARMALPDVAVLRGGVDAWRASGGTLESGAADALPLRWDAIRASVESVKPEALDRELRAAPAPLVLDVGTSDAYAAGHVPGAVWLCRSRLELTIAAAAPSRARACVVACPDGVQSTLAAATLAQLGYRAVRVLEGGRRAWEAAGLALERGATRMGDVADDVVLKPYERGREAMEAYLSWEADLDERGRSHHALLATERPEDIA